MTNGSRAFFIPPSNVQPSNVQPSFLSVEIPAGATVDVPGPAPGFVRVFDNIQLFTTGGASMGAIPIFLFDGSTAWQMFGATPSTQTANYTVTVPLGAGEVFRLGPNPGVDARAVAVYFDIPSENISLVRTQLSATPVVVVPAAPEGFYRQIFRRTLPSVLFNFTGAQVINRDSVACSVRWSLGSLLIGRATLAASTQTTPVDPADLVPVTEEPLSVVLGANGTTTAPILLAAYQQFPLAA